MDKYEYKVRAEEINALIEKRQYAEAVKIADTIDWNRVKSHLMLCKISDLYKINRRYEESREILLIAHERHPGNRKIIYNLCELCIKLEDIVQAVEYYKEFAQIAPKDTGRYILQYRLYEAQDVSLEERIAVLEDYKKRDYREKWAYELAYLYHRIGLETRCIEECDELILWFGEGRYVIKAMELKMLHAALTPEQQEKYDQYKKARSASLAKKEERSVSVDGQTANIDIEGETPSGAMTLPISIKSVNAANVPTAKIPSKKIREGLEETRDAGFDVRREVRSVRPVVEELHEESESTEGQAVEENESEEQPLTQEAATKRLFDRLIRAGAAAVEDAAELRDRSRTNVAEEKPEPEREPENEEEKKEPESETAEDSAEQPQKEDVRETSDASQEEKPTDDLDIQIKTIDVGEYNTINLQQELAKNLAKMLAEEDMGALDATKALPIDTILESTDPELFKNVTNHSVRNHTASSLLQDSDEMTPITEEELLASLDEKPKTADQFGNTKIMMERERAAQESANGSEEGTDAAAGVSAQPETTVRQEQSAEGIAVSTEPTETEQSGVRTVQKPESSTESGTDVTADAPDVHSGEGKSEDFASDTEEGQSTQSGISVGQEQSAEGIAVSTESAETEQSGVQSVPEEASRRVTGVTQAIDASLLNMGELLHAPEEPEEKEAQTSIPAYKTIQTPEGGILKPVTGVTQAIDASVLNMSELLSSGKEPQASHEAETVQESRISHEAESAQESQASREEETAQTSQIPHEQSVLRESEPTQVSHESGAQQLQIPGEQSALHQPETVQQPQTSQEQSVSEQITGQLSFTDIMAEWEETKKATEEKHREEMRQRILRQTGPMFEDFDAMARASVTSDLNLISPMEDVFSDEREPGTEVENALGASFKENEAQTDSGTIRQFFQDAEASLQQEQTAPVRETDEEPVHTQVFNTEEIKGIEEILLSNLQKESTRIEPELVTPVIPDTGIIPTVPVTEPVSEPQSAVTPFEEEVQTYSEFPSLSETPVSEGLTFSEFPVSSESLPQSDYSMPVTQTESVSVENQAQSAQPSPEAGTEQMTSRLNSLVATGEIQFTDLTADAAAGDGTLNRELTEREKELFGSYTQTPEIERQVINAIDNISLSSRNSNVIISGVTGAGSTEVIKNLIKIVQTNDEKFSKKVAKITGSILDKKDIRATLDSLENGALIVEKAGELTPHACEIMVDYVKTLPEGKNILLFMEDTRGNIDKMTGECPQLKDVFGIRIDLIALDNDGLVNYGREYAREQEYTIDEMGMLALYTRIADMQTNDHHVTINEVREIVDEAIANAGKKSVSHIVDVLFSKRFDSDNNIVLREKDFMKDR